MIGSTKLIVSCLFAGAIGAASVLLLEQQPQALLDGMSTVIPSAQAQGTSQKTNVSPKAPTPQPSTPQAATAASSPMAVPSNEVILILIRSSLMALHFANLSDNYQLLHSLCSQPLQFRFSVQDMRATFTGLRNSRLDLTPSLILTPELTGSSGMAANGNLRLIGYFSTHPMRIMFSLEFTQAGGNWRIEGISVIAEPTVAAAQARPKSVSAASDGSPKKP